MRSGLSPPTRGSHLARDHALDDLRSIPAHAGEPAGLLPCLPGAQVYPRPRGGASIIRYILRFGSGSIPAHAGEPAREYSTSSGEQVYPRPRGGAWNVLHHWPFFRGLSPPTRGSRSLVRVFLLYRRSIPAHAGKPCASPSGAPDSRVYPRPRGGALGATQNTHIIVGLSPPTRGSPVGKGSHLGVAGSIPAHAGEPRTNIVVSPYCKVYPRPRGGAGSMASIRSSVAGLSPPTRGSRIYHTPHDDAGGSIPAHAGEPHLSHPTRRCRRVYPRPRGGAYSSLFLFLVLFGLSPPTRGSPGIVGCMPPIERSIPAHAGEPGRRSFQRDRPTVYPRPRGGARIAGTSSLTPQGLSPPTRGSRLRLAMRGSYRGSIPAHAGEPCT